MALAVIMRAGEDGDVAGGIDADRGAFEQTAARAELTRDTLGCQAAGLDVGDDPKAASLAASCRFLPTAGETRPSRDFERLRQRSIVVARVILQHHRGLVGEGVARDEVAPPDLDAIYAEIARCDVDQPLQHESCFGPAGATVGVGWHGVREYHPDLAVYRRGGIDACEQRAIKVGWNVGPERRDVGADIR